MKRSTLCLAFFVLIVATMSMFGASASHCGTGPHDPFGSCEGTSDNNLSCGAGGTNATVAKAYTSASATGTTGAEVCNDNGPVPPYGRAAAYRDSSGNVTIAVDGDRDNPGSQGWTRADVRPGGTGTNCKVQVRRGSTGSYSNGPSDVANSSDIVCP